MEVNLPKHFLRSGSNIGGWVKNKKMSLSRSVHKKGGDGRKKIPEKGR